VCESPRVFPYQQHKVWMSGIWYPDVTWIRFNCLEWKLTMLITLPLVLYNDYTAWIPCVLFGPHLWGPCCLDGVWWAFFVIIYNKHELIVWWRGLLRPMPTRSPALICTIHFTSPTNSLVSLDRQDSSALYSFVFVPGGSTYHFYVYVCAHAYVPCLYFQSARAAGLPTD